MIVAPSWFGVELSYGKRNDPQGCFSPMASAASTAGTAGNSCRNVGNVTWTPSYHPRIVIKTWKKHMVSHPTATSNCSVPCLGSPGSRASGPSQLLGYGYTKLSPGKYKMMDVTWM